MATSHARFGALAAGLGLCLVLSSVTATLPAAAAGVTSAAVTAVAPKPVASATDGSSETTQMGSYADSKFAAAAKKLPAPLLQALSRDLDQSGATYLAQAKAATDAVGVVDSLASAGVDIEGSRVEGTKLVVNVRTADDAAAVTAAGAIADRSAPEVFSSAGKTYYTASDIYDGSGYLVRDYDVTQCSVGFTGVIPASQQHTFATAGHCLAGTSSSATVYPVNPATPKLVSVPSQIGSEMGALYPGSVAFGGGFDSSIVALTSTAAVAKAAVATWGGGKGSLLSSAPLAVLGQTKAIVGATLCKSGSRTGWTCGKVLAVDQTVHVDDGEPKTVNSIIATTCILPGDSGGAAVIGQLAVGINSTTTSATDCTARDYDAGFFPMVSATKKSVQARYGAGWELSVGVPTPVVTSSAATIGADGIIQGTLSSANANHTVELYLDGSATPMASASAASGSWTLSLPGVAAGTHSYRVVARWSTSSVSNPVVGTFSNSVVLQKMSAGIAQVVGTPRVGATLTAVVKSVSPAAESYSYRWRSNGVTVGANRSTYIPSPGQAGKRIDVIVTVRHSGYVALIRNAVQTKPLAVAPMVTSLPKVVGPPNVGQILRADVSAWRPTTATFRYQWLRNGKTIPRATHSTYRLVAADKGKHVDVRVSATQGGYAPATKTSVTRILTANPLLTKSPVPHVVGTPAVGSVLTASAGVWAPKGVALSYRWRVNGVLLAKASGRTYTIPAAARGKVISVTVTGTKKGYYPASRTSPATARVR
ncbi:hypothetical protein [Glaciihabitans sp. dw_435]|uniref:hypothetical protein n=1 Tax=Glaciihabitans sp. dw_435 TaxID=2720081 RepID=UPI001BD3B006|nr:hypothetical protein [Glaciihabitans sp. dw_435]